MPNCIVSMVKSSAPGSLAPRSPRLKREPAALEFANAGTFIEASPELRPGDLGQRPAAGSCVLGHLIEVDGTSGASQACRMTRLRKERRAGDTQL